MEWDPDLWGGSESKPVIYSGLQIGKDITLNYNNMGAVALYETKVVSDVTFTPLAIEIPTAYMPGAFNRYYTYDAASDTLTEVYPTSCSLLAYPFTPSSGYGGVIISNSGQTAAMGAYARTSSVSGTADYFGLFDLRSGCSGTSKWNVVTDAQIATGTNTHRAYVTSGSLANVRANMRQLYLDGAL